MLSDELWNEWIIVQRRSLKFVAESSFSEAMREVDAFMEKDNSPEFKCETLAFRALIKEEMGEILDAMSDLSTACALSQGATYQRYTIELTLGRLSEMIRDIQGASSWYLKAIETAIEDPLTSGAAAVEGFLSTKDSSSWNPGEMKSCETAVRQAWALFSLSGEPDLCNLRGTLQVLAEASTRPLPSTWPHN